MRSTAEKFLTPEYILLVWGLLAGAVAATARWWRRRASTNWTSCQGTVSSHRVRREGHYYLAEVTYSYSVNGEYYSGFLERMAFTRKTAERTADKFPAGMMVVVRVNPARPEISVTRLDDQPGFTA